VDEMSDADYTEYEERPGRDVLEYVEIPLRYPRHMWITFTAVMAVALLLALGMPRKYRSGTMILVESKGVPEYFVVPVNGESMAQRLNTIRQLVLSRTHLEKVIQKLDPYPEFAGAPLHVVVEVMRKAIEIRVQGSDSFMIEYVNRDPHKAMAVTNMLATEFTEDAARLRDGTTEKTFAFLQENLADTRKALEEREAALRNHKQKYWGSLPEQLDSNLRVLGQLQLEQQTLGENLRTLGDRRAVLERNLLEGRRLASVGAGGPGAELVKQRAVYAALSGRYTEDHPDMRAVRARIQALERQVASVQQQKDGEGEKERDLTDPEAVALTRSLRAVEAEIDSLKGRRDKLDARIADFQARVEQTPRAEQELASLIRDYQQLRESYNGALKKEMDAEMSRKLEEYWQNGYFRVLDPAFLPRRPIRPYGALILFGGLAAALGAGLAAAFLADLLDRSVKSERELEELVPHPVLITIPRAALPGKRAATA
jgi:polysaccharide chain length determinant protein (PEP-CTERM system associated)